VCASMFRPFRETELGEVDQQRYPANSVSSALASNRSAVSKPSVNQPSPVQRFRWRVPRPVGQPLLVRQGHATVTPQQRRLGVTRGGHMETGGRARTVPSLEAACTRRRAPARCRRHGLQPSRRASRHTLPCRWAAHRSRGPPPAFPAARPRGTRCKTLFARSRPTMLRSWAMARVPAMLWYASPLQPLWRRNTMLSRRGSIA
jgi:hypothetical protein